MKKHVTLLFVLAFLATQQPVFAQKFGVGIKVGAIRNNWDASGVAFIKNNRLPNFNYLVNPETGAELGITTFQRLSHRFYLNEEVVYGYRVSTVQNSNSGNAKLYNQYVSLPIFLSFNFYKPLSVEFGGLFGTLVKSNDYNFQNVFADFSQFSAFTGIRCKLTQKLNVHCRLAQTWIRIPYTIAKDGIDQDWTIRKRISQSLSMALGYYF